MSEYSYLGLTGASTTPLLKPLRKHTTGMPHGRCGAEDILFHLPTISRLLHETITVIAMLHVDDNFFGHVSVADTLIR